MAHVIVATMPVAKVQYVSWTSIGPIRMPSPVYVPGPVSIPSGSVKVVRR
jgi:hypothetical protein